MVSQHRDATGAAENLKNDVQKLRSPRQKVESRRATSRIARFTIILRRGLTNEERLPPSVAAKLIETRPVERHPGEGDQLLFLFLPEHLGIKRSYN